MKILRITFAIAILLTTHSRAEVINVKMTNNVYTGTALAGPGTTWNNFSGTSGSTKSSLLDSQGNVTPISIQVTYGSSFGSIASLADAPARLLGSGLYGPFSFTVSGLSASKRYTIFTFHYDKAGHATTTQLTGASSTSITPTSTVVSSSFIEGGNFLRFAAVSPSATGTIVCSSSVAWGGLNAVQIVSLSAPKTPVWTTVMSPATPTNGPRISGLLSGGPEAGLARIEASVDLGISATWRPVATLRLDSFGEATFTGIEDTGLSGLIPKTHFFRAVTTP
jgi:hypothetical protein